MGKVPSDSGLRAVRGSHTSGRALRLSDFDFELPPELIAQEPLEERDRSRLLHVDRSSDAVHDHHVSDLPRLLQPGDLLVVNDSRVFPARLLGRTDDGRGVELLLLKPVEENRWEVLVRPAKWLGVGARADFGEGLLQARVVGSGDYGKRTVELRCRGELYSVLDRVGRTPLPPYIKRKEGEPDTTEARDRERYQTVYAGERGSVAAPTAGLHFTRRLLRTLQEGGVSVRTLTLHVGYATFQPIRTENVEEHRIEAEWYTLPPKTTEAIARTRARRGKVVAVGTTTVRALESAAREPGGVTPGPGLAKIYVFPGFRFRVIDALVTNFHLPRSSLFLLVCAFGGVARMRRAYAEAIRRRYRFYSYGDCMLIYDQTEDRESDAFGVAQDRMGLVLKTAGSS